jgi:hypothetical protein
LIWLPLRISSSIDRHFCPKLASSPTLPSVTDLWKVVLSFPVLKVASLLQLEVSFALLPNGHHGSSRLLLLLFALGVIFLSNCCYIYAPSAFSPVRLYRSEQLKPRSTSSGECPWLYKRGSFPLHDATCGWLFFCWLDSPTTAPF